MAAYRELYVYSDFRQRTCFRELVTSKSLHSRKPFVLAKPSIHRMHSRHHCLLIAINDNHEARTDILKIYS